MIPAYKPFDTFIFRTPALPFSEIYDLLKDEQSLITLISEPYINEAIFIASPILHCESIKLIKGGIKDIKEKKRITFSLAKYLLRIGARSTPFGLFAGCSTGIIGTENKILLKSKENYKKNTRLDMIYMHELAYNLGQIPLIKNQIKYYPNNSIYEVGKELRYVEYRYQNNFRKYHIVQVTASEYLKKIIARAVDGALTDELVNSIADKNVSTKEAAEFVKKIIDSQILTSELEPRITGGDFLAQILKTIAGLKIKNEEINNIEDILTTVRNTIENSICSKIGLNEELYNTIIELLSSLAAPIDKGKLFQVDLSKPIKTCELTAEICSDVLEGIKLLSKLVINDINPNLKKFKDAYVEKYQEEQLPLLTVLDTEMGIGYPPTNSNTAETFVDDIAVDTMEGEAEFRWSSIQSFLIKKYLKTIKKNQYEVKIEDDELKNLNIQLNQLPDTLSAMVSILDKDKETGKSKIYLHYVGGSGAANLLGRFCYTDQNIFNLTKNITDLETQLNPDALLAEIVHLPESRIGNIIQRPVLRKYEIPYLSRPSVQKDFQIDVNDLVVSIRANKIILKSKRLNKEIIPRLSTAHNFYINALPIYQFLCDLQTQNVVPTVMFNWGVLSNEYKFLPRVIYKNIIFHLASWNLSRNDFKEIIEANEDSLKDAVVKWKGKFSMPRFIALADGDNELVIDLENIFIVKVFISEIKRRSNVKLVEFPFNKEDLFVKGPEGGFINEFILSFYKVKNGENNLAVKSNILARPITNSVKRNYFPGEEWLYYKFYCGAKTADEILIKIIASMVKELLHTNIIDKWFFIRYSDPQHHLRVRFHLTNTKNYQKIIDIVNLSIASFIEEGLVWKIQTDTYQREIERYGEDTIEGAESLFYADSNAVLSILEILANSSDESYRWLIALKSLDKLMSDFKFDAANKESFTFLSKNLLAKEFGENKNLKIYLDKKYRKHRPLIDKALNININPDVDLMLLYNILSQRSLANKTSVNEIIKRSSKEQLDEYVRSYIHMSINRLFKNKQRIYEFVIYDFLHKYYKSEIAKSKKKVIESSLV